MKDKSTWRLRLVWPGLWGVPPDLFLPNLVENLFKLYKIASSKKALNPTTSKCEGSEKPPSTGISHVNGISCEFLNFHDNDE